MRALRRLILNPEISSEAAGSEPRSVVVADFNRDGCLDGGDIDPFFQCLGGVRP